MSSGIPQSVTRKSIAAHSWLGLFAGALMYVICLSGTIAVVIPELERWEQPYAEEFRDYDAAVLDAAFNRMVADGGIDVTPHMYLVLPTDEVPRARVASENESWFLNADGSVGETERNAWSELMLDLHLYLHLPKSWGMLLVSAMGAILVGLTVSGLFAHRRILRDAFKWRTGGTRAVAQLDIHNRLSVWSTPFILVIAVTGAWFGLALPYLGAASQAFYDGDNDRVIESVFGSEPELDQEPGPLAIATALEHLQTYEPDATPIFVVVHDAGTRGQFMSIAGTLPGRLIYAENYLYSADGRFLRTDSFKDGEAGRQVIYSIYRLHFGYFGGAPVKLAYVLLGLAMCVISVTGINVWLARRKKIDALNDVWVGIVWGVPLAITLAAIAEIIFALPSLLLLWLSVLTASTYAAASKDPERCRNNLLIAFAASLLLLAALHTWRFGSDALQGFPLAVNLGLLLAGLAVFATALRRRTSLGIAAELSPGTR